MKTSIIFHGIRILLALVFIFSAISKLLSVDNFELYIFSQHICGFDLSGIIARLIISAEISIGLLLLFNFYFNIISKLTLYILLFFSLFLAFKLIVSANENCNCFGDIIVFNAGESLLKNFILIVLLLLIRHKAAVKKSQPLWLLVSVLAVSFSLPFIYSPPDIIYRRLYPNSRPVNSELIQLSDTTLNVAEGKKRWLSSVWVVNIAFWQPIKFQ